jgi:chromatin segregation and condensation protein Rec8/ScpA/Scc1 (kleisin family)
MAMLELAKIKSILLRQANSFGEIHIYKRPDSPPAGELPLEPGAVEPEEA